MSTPTWFLRPHMAWLWPGAVSGVGHNMINTGPSGDNGTGSPPGDALAIGRRLIYGNWGSGGVAATWRTTQSPEP